MNRDGGLKSGPLSMEKLSSHFIMISCYRTNNQCMNSYDDKADFLCQDL